ncbi:MAG TPA: efflux RND transporter periplasmic adaptor subunit [Candidatus Acidoferrales bacterium]|nr:efflux RND transporter periplasmic adaptor subunit [Candidatus Acidoferrales bacterium]
MFKVFGAAVGLWIRSAALLTAAATIAACGKKPAPAPSPLPSVSVVTAQTGTIRPQLQVAGVVAPYREIGIAADLTEPIESVSVQEGDRVHAGQVLATLLTDDLAAQLASAEQVADEDVARYEQTAYQVNAVTIENRAAVRSAQATLRQAQANLSGAWADFQRYANLAAKGYLSQETLDQQRTTVESDRDAVASARAALYQAVANEQASGNGVNAGAQQQELQAARAAAQAAQLTVAQLKNEIARATIVAPVGGVVESVNANPGEYPTQRQLFTIDQIASVYAVLPSSSAQAVEIHRGATATVTVNGSTRKDFGIVTAVLDEIQPGTTNFTVKVLVSNADYHLHAGMPVTGYVNEPPLNGVVVPVTAFVDDTRQSVYAVDDRGVVSTHSVKEINDDGTNAVVTGLPPGSHVIKDVEQSSVGNGDRVALAP